jgi:hypothetical protein
MFLLKLKGFWWNKVSGGYLKAVERNLILYHDIVSLYIDIIRFTRKYHYWVVMDMLLTL